MIARLISWLRSRNPRAPTRWHNAGVGRVILADRLFGGQPRITSKWKD